MNGRISRILTAAAVLLLVGLVILAIPSFFDPEFEVVNNSPEAVSDIATWRNNEKEIGNIPPESRRQFSVKDEAAMKLNMRNSSGKEIESEPMYFTRGTKVIATISSSGIEVRYDFDT